MWGKNAIKPKKRSKAMIKIITIAITFKIFIDLHENNINITAPY